MITSFKLFKVFFLTFIFSCHVTENNNRQTLQDSVTDNKPMIFRHENISTDTTKVNLQCVIDTVGILKNRNLAQLIKQLEKTKLVIYKITKAIPPFIMNFLKCSQGGNFSIANPGEHWQSTDVKIGNLPDRQLIFFGISDSIAMMAHFTGGIGKSEHILIFRFNNNKIIDFWCGNILANLTDKQQALNFINKNKTKKWGLNTNIIYF